MIGSEVLAKCASKNAENSLKQEKRKNYSFGMKLRHQISNLNRNNLERIRKSNRVAYSKNDVVMALSEGNDEPKGIALEGNNVSGAECLEIPGRSFNSSSVYYFSTFWRSF